MTEEVIGGEQRAWLATSQAAKQLAKAASAAAGEDEGAAMSAAKKKTDSEAGSVGR